MPDMPLLTMLATFVAALANTFPKIKLFTPLMRLPNVSMLFAAALVAPAVPNIRFAVSSALSPILRKTSETPSTNSIVSVIFAIFSPPFRRLVHLGFFFLLLFCVLVAKSVDNGLFPSLHGEKFVW
jgi:hypothetical protein